MWSNKISTVPIKKNRQRCYIKREGNVKITEKNEKGES
jgi:hypothetical protein